MTSSTVSSVKGRRLFADLRAQGIRVRSGAVRMTYLPLASAEGPQIAFALSKRFGNAVERNRARRRLRSAFTEVWHDQVRWAEAPSPRPVPGAVLMAGSRRLLSQDFDEVKGDVFGCLTECSRRLAEVGR